ncbi:hypothetical protein MATL_G00086990 [Megalops atlanticus]|uniref:NMDA receptor synaptonuclear signaling and neuronal migration factor n=1 Tax=Megalops atlanticus TaxID=7932 RepID=A0A9D3Q6C4_MEGAT|nr:hypothetical protein MATL_G00086990 [Megalops atlanticus]
MGTAVSKRKNLRNDAISSVAAKVRAARAFGEYLSHNHPENRNGSDHLLSDTFIGQDSDSPDTICPENNNLHPHTVPPAPAEPSLSKQQAPPPKRRASLECVLSGGEEQPKGGEASLQPARVYTITGEGGMLGSRGSKERLELEHHHHHHGGHQHGNHHHGGHHHVHHHHHHSHQPSQPLQSSVSAHNIRGWGEGDGKGGSREDCSLGCEACGGAPSHSQRSLDLESSARDAEENINSWFPKENMFSFQTATTTMQAIS